MCVNNIYYIIIENYSKFFKKYTFTFILLSYLSLYLFMNLCNTEGKDNICFEYI